MRLRRRVAPSALADLPVRFVYLFEYESLTGRMAGDVEIWAAEMDRELLAATAAGRR